MKETAKESTIVYEDDLLCRRYRIVLFRQQPHSVQWEKRDVRHSYVRNPNRIHELPGLLIRTGVTFPSAVSPAAVLVLTRNQLHMAGFAKQPPVQWITAAFIGFRIELDDTDLQTER